MQTRRKESRKERRSHRNKKATVLRDDPLSIFPEIAVRFIDENRKIQNVRREKVWDESVKGVVSRAIFTIAFGCVRHKDRLKGDEVYEDDIPQFRADVVYIIPIARWYRKFYTVRREETRASSYAHIRAYVYLKAYKHVIAFHLPSPRGSNFIPAEYRALEIFLSLNRAKVPP